MNDGLARALRRFTVLRPLTGDDRWYEKGSDADMVDLALGLTCQDAPSYEVQLGLETANLLIELPMLS